MPKDRPIYLDYAAATPLDPRVLAAMHPYLSNHFHNPSATYLAARSIAQDIESARGKIAHWLGAKPSEIIFTAGGTEADNLAIQGIMGQFPESNLIISAIEHPAVLEPASRYSHKKVSVSSDGLVDVSQLEALIDDQTVLVSIIYANNEIGTIEPLRRIAQTIASLRKERQKKGNKLPLLFHTDACQAAGYLDLHVSRLGVDMMTLNAGKIYGPKQSGALYVRAGTLFQPQILGGGQEHGFRSGTENVANIVGFAAALDMAQAGRHAESERLLGLQQLFFNLLKENLPAATINGSVKNRLPNNVHMTIPGCDNERLIMELDERYIQCAAGSACSAAHAKPSHVLSAIGLSESAARSSLRFTMGRDTTEKDIRQTVSVLTTLLEPDPNP